MPEFVDEVPGGRYASYARYPWGEWLDGRMRKFTQGVDFDVSPRAFRSTAAAAAKRAGVKAIVAMRGDDVYVQAHLDGEGVS